jgi:hypothetical protein
MAMDSVSPLAKNIPEIVFMLYQMTFAVITVALVAGSVADRMRFSAFLWFVIGWLLLVYAPIAHWVWGGGFLQAAGMLDFAGGTVVHLNAGIAGLVAAYILGKRRGYGTENLAPYDLALAVIGSGFQAQSQVDAIRCVRDVQDLRVWSRHAEKRDAFAKINGGRAVDTAEQAVRGADIVVTATFAKDPVVEDSWFEHGTHGVHINAMGSNRDQRRELPSRLVHRADLFAVDSIEVAKIEAGDLVMAPVDWSASIGPGSMFSTASENILPSEAMGTTVSASAPVKGPNPSQKAKIVAIVPAHTGTATFAELDAFVP